MTLDYVLDGWVVLQSCECSCLVFVMTPICFAVVGLENICREGLAVVLLLGLSQSGLGWIYDVGLITHFAKTVARWVKIDFADGGCLLSRSHATPDFFFAA